MTWPSQGRPNQIRIIWLHLRPSYNWNVKRKIIMLFMKEIELWMSCPFEWFPEENIFSSLPSWQWKMFYVHVFFRAKKFTGWLAGSKRNSPRQKPRRRLPSWKRCRFCLFFFVLRGNYSGRPTQGNSKHDNAKTAAAGLKFSCAVCRSAST